MEFKGTKGTWYVERASEDGEDYQARVLSNLGKVYHSGSEVDQIMIIVGEPQKRKGQANIHVEANAQLIAAAPKLLEVCIAFMKLFQECDMRPEDECYELADMVQDAIDLATKKESE